MSARIAASALVSVLLLLLSGCHTGPAKALVDAPKPGLVGQPSYGDSLDGKNVIFQSRELPDEIHSAIAAYCARRGLIFTPDPPTEHGAEYPQFKSWTYASPKEEFSVQVHPDIQDKTLNEVIYDYTSKKPNLIEIPIKD